MFPAVTSKHNTQPTELVDDAASSICIDAQDYMELDKAIEVLQDQPEPATDFEKYNQMVARQMILDQSLDDSTIDLESFKSSRHYPVDLPHLKYDDFKLMVLGGCASMLSMYELQEAIARDGPVGMIIGSIIGLLMYNFAFNGPTEMMAFQPLESYGAYIDRYFHESIGSALDCVYWWSCIASAGQELIVSLLMFTQFEELNTADNNYIVWMIYLFVGMSCFLLVSRHIRLAAASITSLLNTCIMVTIIVMLLLATTGKLPPRFTYTATKFWYEGCGGIMDGILCGKFQPKFGKLGGTRGRSAQVADSIITSFKVAATTDKTFTLVSKLRNPRKALPKAIKYRAARNIILFMLPTICIALGTAMNDPLLYEGKAIVNLYHQTSKSDSDPSLNNLACPIYLSRWRHFKGIRTFLPLAVPFIRAEFCDMDLFIAATSIFMSTGACLWYLVGASETLEALSGRRPFVRVFARFRHKAPAFRLFNILLTAFHVVACWFGLSTFYEFMAVTRSSYSFLLMGLLNVAYIRFVIAVNQHKDGYLNRNDEDWPYRSIGGVPIAVASGFFSFTMLFVHWPLYACAYNYWSAWYGMACLLPLIVLVAISAIHWYWFRPELRDIKKFDLVGAKRALDEQEWVEDRVFRRGVWAAVYRWSGLAKFLVKCLWVRFVGKKKSQ